MAKEMRELVCRLTDEEKISYRSEVAELGIALGEILESLKAKLQEIKVARQRQQEVLDAIKFRKEESADRDDHGRTVLYDVGPDRLLELQSENTDLATALEELTEQRSEIHNQRKATKDEIASRLKALKWGQEERTVECEWRPVFEHGQSKLYRMDTGECIDSRALTDEEAQESFAFEVPSPKPRIMIACPVCTAMVGAGGQLDRHYNGSDQCLGGGLTLQQAADYAARMAQHDRLPDAETLAEMRSEVQATEYGEGRVHTPDDDQEEQDHSEAPSELVAWDAADALPGYLAQLGINNVSEIRPSELDALLRLAGEHAQDLSAYLLAQSEDLKTTTRRALKAWGK
jgi:hypothetical protein